MLERAPQAAEALSLAGDGSVQRRHVSSVAAAIRTADREAQ
jgi:hypothetical protein